MKSSNSNSKTQTHKSCKTNNPKQIPNTKDSLKENANRLRYLVFTPGRRMSRKQNEWFRKMLAHARIKNPKSYITTHLVKTRVYLTASLYITIDRPTFIAVNPAQRRFGVFNGEINQRALTQFVSQVETGKIQLKKKIKVSMQ